MWIFTLSDTSAFCCVRLFCRVGQRNHRGSPGSARPKEHLGLPIEWRALHWGSHRCVVDRPRWRHADAAALPPPPTQGSGEQSKQGFHSSTRSTNAINHHITQDEVVNHNALRTCQQGCLHSSGLEEVQDAHLHCGPDGRQQHPDEKGPDHIPLSPPYRCHGRSCRNGELSQDETD